MRRAALLAALALPLAGCVTYEVVDHDTYYRRSDGAIVYRGEVYYPETRVLDPYDAWFYGWRGPVVVLDRWHDPWYDPWFDPWFGSRVSVSRWSSGWYWSVGLGWWSPWPHGWGYGWGHGWQGSGWSRPPGGGHRPPPAEAIERPMPKPVVLGSGPTVDLPPRAGPRADGEAVWPGAASPRWQEARPMPRRPVEVPAEVGADRLRRMPEAPVRIERPMQREAPIQAGRPLYREPSVPVERPMPIERPVMAERPMPIERPVMAERPPAFERPLPAERPAPAWTPSPREERSPEAEERIE